MTLIFQLRDATGHFIRFLVQSPASVRSLHLEKGRADVGGLKAYEECCNKFAQGQGMD